SVARLLPSGRSFRTTSKSGPRWSSSLALRRSNPHDPTRYSVTPVSRMAAITGIGRCPLDGRFRVSRTLKATWHTTDFGPVADLGRRKTCLVLAHPQLGDGRTGNNLRSFRTIQVRL